MSEKVSYYIQGMGNISPQKTFDNTEFLNEITAQHENMLLSVTPEFKNYIHPVQLRRMSRMFKIGLSAAKICAQDAQLTMPDGIITASGYGEKQLTPTLFMQSTYNSISGGIAMAMKCNNYNTTYVHRGFAFETGLEDAMMQIQDMPSKRILLGGFDETNDGQFKISVRTGYYKKKLINSLTLFESDGQGTFQGEGASFFTIGGLKTENTYCEVAGVKMLYAPKDETELVKTMEALLLEAGIAVGDIDVVINGIGGDDSRDRLNNLVMKEVFPATQQVVFKHLCGDYCTASSFGMWLGAKMLRHQSIPEIIKVNDLYRDAPIKNVLLVNHFRGKNYGVILLKAV